MNPEQAAKLEELKEWLASAEGAARVEDTMRDAENFSAKLDEARRLDDDCLNRPVTI